MSEDGGFACAAAGVLLLYVEAMFPGKLAPLIAGSMLAAVGANSLAGHGPSVTGLVFVLLSAAVWVAGVWLPTPLITGVAGTLCLAAGSFLLFPQGRGITPRLGVPVSVVLGAATSYLSASARGARLNKRFDL